MGDLAYGVKDFGNALRKFGSLLKNNRNGIDVEISPQVALEAGYSLINSREGDTTFAQLSQNLILTQQEITVPIKIMIGTGATGTSPHHNQAWHLSIKGGGVPIGNGRYFYEGLTDYVLQVMIDEMREQNPNVGDHRPTISMHMEEIPISLPKVLDHLLVNSQRGIRQERVLENVIQIGWGEYRRSKSACLSEHLG